MWGIILSILGNLVAFGGYDMVKSVLGDGLTEEEHADLKRELEEEARRDETQTRITKRGEEEEAKAYEVAGAVRQSEITTEGRREEAAISEQAEQTLGQSRVGLMTSTARSNMDSPFNWSTINDAWRG